ncbi:MAG: GrpB family protein [Sporolactobacillus sp.]
MSDAVKVVAYQESWEDDYKRESSRLLSIFRPTVCRIAHIGSTAVPGLAAKPTIDVLITVAQMAAVDELNEAMQAAGYRVLGENGIAGRRYFVKRDAEGNHLVHVHVFAEGCADVDRHLAFRDYLRAHNDDALFYGQLKKELADACGDDRDRYAAGKDAVIKRIETCALQWWYNE